MINLRMEPVFSFSFFSLVNLPAVNEVEAIIAIYRSIDFRRIFRHNMSVSFGFFDISLYLIERVLRKYAMR
jgi:hypothetical protein